MSLLCLCRYQDAWRLCAQRTRCLLCSESRALHTSLGRTYAGGLCPARHSRGTSHLLRTCSGARARQGFSRRAAWTVRELVHIKVVKGRRRSAAAICIGSAGQFVFCACPFAEMWVPYMPLPLCAGHIAIWDARSPKPALRVKAHDADVNVMSWNALASCMLVTGCDDGSFRIWCASLSFDSIPLRSFM